MGTFLLTLQIVISLILTTLILLQAKGAGLGSAFGGSASIIRTRRGAEKFLFYLSIIASFLFLAVSLLNVLIA
jgi:preprotein translocase subunit SecG